MTENDWNWLKMGLWNNGRVQIDDVAAEYDRVRLRGGLAARRSPTQRPVHRRFGHRRRSRTTAAHHPHRKCNRTVLRIHPFWLIFLDLLDFFGFLWIFSYRNHSWFYSIQTAITLSGLVIPILSIGYSIWFYPILCDSYLIPSLSNLILLQQSNLILSNPILYYPSDPANPLLSFWIDPIRFSSVNPITLMPFKSNRSSLIPFDHIPPPDSSAPSNPIPCIDIASA